MATDKIRKYVLPNIPYLFIGWFCLKIGTAYRLAAGTGFGEKLLGLGQTIGAAFASFAPGLAPLDWFVGIVGAAGFRLLIYCKAKKAKKFRRDAEYGTARWGNEKDIKPFLCGGRPQGRCAGTGRLVLAKVWVQNQGVQQHRFF